MYISLDAWKLRSSTCFTLPGLLMSPFFTIEGVTLICLRYAHVISSCLQTLLSNLSSRESFVFFAQDYDDSYALAYAQMKDAVIISNDMYRDFTVRGQVGTEASRRFWVKTHCCSYTFMGDDFMPNPDFVWPTKYQLAFAVTSRAGVYPRTRIKGVKRSCQGPLSSVWVPYCKSFLVTMIAVQDKYTHARSLFFN